MVSDENMRWQEAAKQEDKVAVLYFEVVLIFQSSERAAIIQIKV